MPRLSGLLAGLCLLLWPPIAYGGALDIWLHGTVTDTEGAPLSGVEVLVRPQEEQAQAVALEASTNRHGKYRLLLRRGELRYVMVLHLPHHQSLVKVVQPLALPPPDQPKGLTPVSGRRTFQVDFVMPSEENVVERARADDGRGKVPEAELLYAARVLQNRAVAAAHDGALDLAEELFVDAIRLDPSLAGAHSGLAKLLHARGDLEELAAAAERAWELGLRDPQVALLRCEALDGLDRRDELGQAVAHLRSVDPAAASDHLLRRATRSAATGADAEASRRLDELLAFDPVNVEARHLAAEVALRLGQVAEAAGHLETLVAAAPDHPYAISARKLLAEIDRLESASPEP
jgi:tetratricopeptide (TPR) repeat protein